MLDDTATTVPDATYRGELPVSEQQVRRWRDAGVRRVRVCFTSNLYDLIESQGFVDFDENVGHLIGDFLGVLDYGLDTEGAPAPNADGRTVYLFADGTLDGH